MKVWRGITLALWIMLMTGCVSLVATYYILAGTILNPTIVKKWLNDSGAYSTLAEAIVPMLTADQKASETPSSSPITKEMLERAAKASIKPEDVKAKAEPIIDATYAWLDSKSPEINFSLSANDETKRFLEALRGEVLTKVKALPECTGYVDPAALEQAGCLPWYVSAETATDAVMKRVEQQDTFRDMKITPDSFKGKSTATLSDKLPDVVSALWVAQLIAMPVFGAAALFVIAKRRGAGLIAVGSSMLTPGLILLVIGLILYFGASTTIEAFVKESEFAAIAESLGKVVARSLATITLQASGVLAGVGAVAIGLGIWWKKRARRAK